MSEDVIGLSGVSWMLKPIHKVVASYVVCLHIPYDA